MLSADEKAKYKFIETKNGSIILIRPHLDEFLDFLVKEDCWIALWTLSEREYAQEMANGILARWPKKFVYGAEDDEAASDAGFSRKAVAYLGRGDEGEDDEWRDGVGKNCISLCNTILIDDLPANSVNKDNMHNSITVAPFAPWGERKDRADPYIDCSGDTAFLECMDIIKRVLPKARACYAKNPPVRALQSVRIFSPENIAEAGLQKYVKTIKLVEKKGERNVRGIGVGKSHLFVGGRRRTIKRILRVRSTRRRFRRKE